MSEVTTPENIKMEEAKFRFKKDKLGNQRPNVELKIPVPTASALIEFLSSDSKESELIHDAIYDVVRGVVAEWVGKDEGNDATKFNPEDFTWAKIANMPKEDRRSIPQEQWEEFSKDYMAVMPGVTGKSEEAIGNAVTVYAKKFAQVKTNKPVITKLKDQLALYMQNSTRAEEFTDVLETLLRRADAYLAADDIQALVENL